LPALLFHAVACPPVLPRCGEKFKKTLKYDDSYSIM